MKGHVRTYSAPVSNPQEIGTIYVGAEDRYIVSLVVGYDEVTVRESMGGFEHTPHVNVEDKAKQAAAAALALVTDDASADTHWFVYDRSTRRLFEFEQGEFNEREVR